MKVLTSGRVKVPTGAGVDGQAMGPPPGVHAVAITVGDDDPGVVHEPVQQAGGGGVFGQDVAPVAQRQIGRRTTYRVDSRRSCVALSARVKEGA